MRIEIAGVSVDIQERYPEIRPFVQNYLIADTGVKADIQISVTDKDIEFFQVKTEEDFSRGVHEITAVLAVLCDQILDFDAFFLHAAVVAVGGEAFAFTARSGMGKSTHVRQWLQYFGEKAFVVNGDKPFLFKRGEELLAAGTPWCGKEGWETNVQVPLKGICFLERGAQNRMRLASQEEVMDRLFPQLRLPRDSVKLAKLMNLLDWTIQNIPFYILECTISEAAAQLAYQGMHKGLGSSKWLEEQSS
ncbi:MULTISPECIES: hypothetical protein [unclassified Streptococcus]|uniref:hypothetical protein n=1 Tax=unclassified Streptococcus TaxID=2608887 RepID=UPI0018ABAE78|nr:MULTISPECIES: hypothetical protein [unclassified Streptococcus]MBF8970798.1 hypothetical protein [Streptococcus sp. NLN76]MBG9368164.1 hypothetical protein [Streptococcus sp. NLN64]